jgi:hypothetical protein
LSFIISPGLWTHSPQGVYNDERTQCHFTVLLMSRILITIICLRATRRPSIQLSRVAVYPDHYHCRRQPYACKQYSNIHSPPFISCSVASLISESLFLIFYSHHVLCSVSLYLFSLIRILYIHSRILFSFDLSPVLYPTILIFF